MIDVPPLELLYSSCVWWFEQGLSRGAYGADDRCDVLALVFDRYVGWRTG